MASAPTRLIMVPVKKYFLSYACPWKEVYRNYAGHSKWANIKHIKATKDSERAAIFTRLSRQMRVAIAEGGSSSPATNLQLARSIDQAKKLNMPQAAIQQILTSADKDHIAPRKPYQFELKGPGGFVLIVDIRTSNLARTRNDFGAFLRKAQASVSEGVRYLFDKKGVIQATSLKSYPLDTVIENAIEGGADDVSEIEGEDGKLIFQFYSDPDVLNTLKAYLESRDYSVHFASIEYLPINIIELNEENSKLALRLLQSLNDHPDVMAVYNNFS